MKSNCVGLKNAHGESANSVVSLDACAICILDADTGLAPSDFSHNNTQQQPKIVFSKKSGRFPTNEGVISALIVNRIIDFGESIVSRVLQDMSSI